MPRRSQETNTANSRRRQATDRTATSRRANQQESDTKKSPDIKKSFTPPKTSNKPRRASHARKPVNQRTDRQKAPEAISRKAPEENKVDLKKKYAFLENRETALRPSTDKTSATEDTKRQATQNTHAIKKVPEKSTRHGKGKVDAEMRKSFIKLIVMIAVGIGSVIGIYFGVQAILAHQVGFQEIQKTQTPTVVSTQTPQERNQASNTSDGEVAVTPNPSAIRDISFGAKDIEFKERQINIPGAYDNELLFSAGSGSLSVGGTVLTKLYLYNLDEGVETLIAQSTIPDFGEIYETHLNHKWLVWLETDHGEKNYIMIMNRETQQISKIQSLTSGQPKLQLYGDLLVWMQQASSTEDRLVMYDLTYQEQLPLFTFTDKATYGVSSPCVYENTIVWSGPDPNQTDEDKQIDEHSAVYYLELNVDESGTLEDEKYFTPGTYVHEPLYNGDVFVWLDGNKSPNSNLYVGRPDEEAKIIATGVTTYSVGDGIVVFGKDQAVWVYVTATEELCRLTSPEEMGMLPSVTKRTVVWYNLSAESNKDVLRYKVLTDDELYPGGKPDDQ